MISHIKNWFRTLDTDQRDTVVSSGWILAIAILIEAIFQPEIGLMFIWPLQYAITYFGFARGTVIKSKGWYVDKRSGIRWKKSHWIARVSMICHVIGIVLLDGVHNALLRSIVFLSPLLISRLIVFIKKLPLGALYYFDARRHLPKTDFDSRKSDDVSITTDPSYSWHSSNIYYIEHKHH